MVLNDDRPVGVVPPISLIETSEGNHTLEKIPIATAIEPNAIATSAAASCVHYYSPSHLPLDHSSK